MSSFVLRNLKQRSSHRLARETIIGRTQGRLRLPADKRVSGRHCRIDVSSDGVCIVDLHSGNGTFVNDARLEPDVITPLAPGDVIAVGDHVFELAVADRVPWFERPVVEWACFGGAALCLALVFAGPVLKKRPAPSPAPVVDAFQISLHFVSDEFDRAATDYAVLLDSVIVDDYPKEMAAVDFESRLGPLFDRLAKQTSELKPVTTEEKQLVDLQAKKITLLKQHMSDLSLFWKTKDLKTFHKSVADIAEYKKVALEMRALIDRREGNQSVPEAKARERLPGSTPDHP